MGGGAVDSVSELQVFAKVVEQQGFTAAARALELPKSSVSRTVARLEDRLGVRLLQRTTRSLNLTDAGATFYGHATRILADIEQAERAVHSLAEVPRGTLRISAPLSFGSLFLGDLVADYMAQHHEVDVEVVLSDRLVDLIEEGFDLVVRVGALRDSSLVARKLGQAARRLVASPAYLAEHGTPTEPADLSDHQCLLYGYEATGANWRLAQGPEVAVTGRLRSNNGSVLRAAALKGHGIAFLPEFLVACDLHTGRLVELLPQHEHAEAGIWVVYPHGRHLSAKVRAFVDLAVAAFADGPPWQDDLGGRDARRD
jgi:DNA-binding transcriptional LysR family regulator